MSEPTDFLAEPEERPWEEPGSYRMDCEPNGAPLIKFFAKVGVALGAASALCGALALVGIPLNIWVFVTARRDLAMMRAGTMDPAGRADTEIARGDSVNAIVLSLVGLVITGPFLLLRIMLPS